jgi:hypothetical protein
MDISGDGNVLAFVYNNSTSWICFIINFSGTTSYQITYSSTPYFVNAWSAIIVTNENQLVYNTSNPFYSVSAASASTSDFGEKHFSLPQTASQKVEETPLSFVSSLSVCPLISFFCLTFSHVFQQEVRVSRATFYPFVLLLV